MLYLPEDVAVGIALGATMAVTVENLNVSGSLFPINYKPVFWACVQSKDLTVFANF